MKLTIPPLQISETAGFTPQFDIFNRKPYGEKLFQLIKNTQDSLVLALDAPWGEGKTTFIKMWRGYLHQQEVRSIHFDAFENDYQQEPFLAISSQIYNLIDKKDETTQEKYKTKAVAAMKVIGRAGLRIGMRALTAGIVDDTAFEGASASNTSRKR